MRSGSAAHFRRPRDGAVPGTGARISRTVSNQCSNSDECAARRSVYRNQHNQLLQRTGQDSDRRSIKDPGAGLYNGDLDLERTLLRKVGDAVARFKMIRDGDRVAVALSGGKDSLTLLEILLRLRERAPVEFSVCAFTVEQGKFLRPFEPLGEYLKARGVDWTYHRDAPSLRLIEQQPGHGCDLCSRYRRRAVYQIVRGLGANVIAFGHTADDFCESFLRNALFTGRISSLPPVTWS